MDSSCGVACMHGLNQKTNTNHMHGSSKQTQTICMAPSTFKPNTFQPRRVNGSKYEREYGKDFDADLKLAILSEVAPKALAPQIAMNSAYLTSYKAMREFIVQYLKSKNLWKRSAGTSFGSGTVSSSSQLAPNSGPVPMDVGAVDVPETKGKGKGKPSAHKNNDGVKGGKKGRSKGEGKGKEKGKDKHNPGKTSEGKGPPCAICGPIKGKSHTIEECYFNARVNPKGEGKGGKKGTSNPRIRVGGPDHGHLREKGAGKKKNQASMLWTKTITKQQHQQSRPC